MTARPLNRLLQLPRRCLHTSTPLRLPYTPRPRSPNRVFDSVRSPADLHTLLLLSASSCAPLLTLWGAPWDAPSRAAWETLLSLVEGERVGEEEGGVGVVQVEVDAPTIGDLGSTYAITALPTLLAFSRQGPQLETKVTRIEDLKSRKFLTEWILREARRGGEGGAGGSWFGSS